MTPPARHATNIAVSGGAVRTMPGGFRRIDARVTPSPVSGANLMAEVMREKLQ